MISLPTSNEDVFGKVEFTMVRHSNFDIIIIPFNDAHNNINLDRKVLAFAVARPYEYESLTKQVISILKKL